jgi:hypothetical protein
MPVNTVGTVADLPYIGTIANLSAASLDYLPVAKQGRLVGGSCAMSAATTVAAAVVTIKKYPAGVVANAVTCGTITVSQTGSAAGIVTPLVITGSELNCTFAPGDTLVIDNAAGSTGASVGRFSLIIRGV